MSNEKTEDQGKDAPIKGLIPRVVEVVKEYADSRKLGDDICLLGFSLNPLAADRQ